MDKQAVEAQLCQLPVSQYAWIDPREIEFSERVRYACEHECPMYGTSWACPPAVGTVEACRNRVLSYPGALVFTSLSCAICPKCAYPDAPCRHPDRMFPCVESYGIVATALAERNGIEFYNGNLVTWFSVLCYR